jgi:hypothetical protein
VVCWCRVVEPQRNGNIHLHAVVVMPRDIRTGVDFEAFERRDYRSASQYLRDWWALLREKAPLYGFGRCELIPVKKAAAVGWYVGKYLGKAGGDEAQDFRGRRVAYSRGWLRSTSMRRGWAAGAGAEFRHLCQEMDSATGGGLGLWVEQVGPKWAHRLMRAWQHGRWGWKDEAGNRAELPLQALAEHLCDVLRVPHMRPKADTGGLWGPIALAPVVTALCEAFGGAVEWVDDIPTPSDVLASVISPRDTLAARP